MPDPIVHQFDEDGRLITRSTAPTTEPVAEPDPAVAEGGRPDRAPCGCAGCRAARCRAYRN